MGRTAIGALGVLLAGAVLGAAGAPGRVAQAGELSTEVLWGGAGTDGRGACLRAGGRIVEMPVAHVNPFGVQGAGADAALAAQDDRSALCVFGAMGPGVAAAVAPAWRVAATDNMATASIAQGPFGGRCAEECDASLTLLTESDREALIALPERVRQTLLAVPADPGADDGGTRVARAAAATLTGQESEPELLAAPLDLSPGDVDCTWRRFESGRVLVEPTGRCRIGRDDAGAPTLEQLAGGNLALRLQPLTDQYSVYLGRLAAPGETERLYRADAAAPAQNNRTGLAARVGNQVHLVGASGESGFAVLTLSGN